MFNKFLQLFGSFFGRKRHFGFYFPAFIFPVVDLKPRKRKHAEGFTQPDKAPKTPQSAFVDSIPVFTVEEEAFEYWKKNCHPEATVNSLVEYKKNWRKFRYHVWAVRLLNVYRTSGYYHDPNFPVLYFVVDSEYEYVSNRLSDDIRHWYIKYVKANYSKNTIKTWGKIHKELAQNPKAFWEQDINPTRRTIK
jgi:hypothetical protein